VEYLYKLDIVPMAAIIIMIIIIDFTMEKKKVIALTHKIIIIRVNENQIDSKMAFCGDAKALKHKKICIM